MAHVAAMNSPLDLASLKNELHQLEERILTDRRERDWVWLDLMRRGMLLIARMMVEVKARGERPQPRSGIAPSSALPNPGLVGQAIDVEQFRAHTPEKFELIGGFLFDDAEHPENRLRLLSVLLVNVGLVEAVRQAPEALWREALDRVYGGAS